MACVGVADAGAPGVGGDGVDVGALVGPYRLVKLIGRGGMGVVFEARHERIGQRAAIKLLRPEKRTDVSSSALRRFLLEARALSRLSHPGLVRVFDCGETPTSGPWIAMEYVDGESLRDRLVRLRDEGRRMALGDALRIARQIASAVAAIHEASIVHRDLKPDNIMMVADEEAPSGERIKLLDFGIAKLLDGEASNTTEGAVLGTAGYMAPEQCAGVAEIDGRADVYALGVLLYELLAGARPFSGNAFSIMQQHVFDAPPPIESRAPGLPEGLPGLISAMLAKDPSKRPGIHALVEQLRALQHSAGGAPSVPARPSESPPRTGAEVITAPPSGSHDTTLSGSVAVRTPASQQPGEPASRPGAPPSSRGVPVSQPAERRGSRRWAVLVAASALVGGAIAGWLSLRPPKAPASVTLPGMVRIPGGTFRMGSSQEEIDAACARIPGGCPPEATQQIQREKPAHEVTVSPFQIDIDEVTNQEYAQFLSGMGKLIEVRDDADRRIPRRYVHEQASGLLLIDLHDRRGGIEQTAGGQLVARMGREHLAVVQVTWDGAAQYCRYMGKRLPTEAEWEIAARGAARRLFPWGDEPPRCDGVVLGRDVGHQCPDLPESAEPVGKAKQDVTPEAVRGLGGNVSEWVQDPFLSPYYGDCGRCIDPVADQAAPLAEDIRMFRGGTFRGDAWFARAATRSRWKRTEVMDGLGFRCASR
jgi:serine/threonine protein kinase